MANYITSREYRIMTRNMFTHTYIFENFGDWLPETTGSSLDPRLFVTDRVQSVHTSNSVKVLSSFHQVSCQQEYSFHNRYIFATLEYYDP